MAASLGLLMVHHFLTCHSEPRLHPVLAQRWAGGVLVTAALLNLPLAVDALGGVMLQGHLFTLVLQRVERLRLPLHQPVLHDKLDPLGGVVGPGCTHAVPFGAAVVKHDILSFFEYTLGVKGLHCLAQHVDVLVARLRKFDDLVGLAVKLFRYQPQVVTVSFGSAGGAEGLVCVFHVLDDVVVRPNGPVLYYVRGFLRAAASDEDDQDGCSERCRSSCEQGRFLKLT